MTAAAHSGAAHDEVLREAIETNGGFLFKITTRMGPGTGFRRRW